MNWVLLWLIGKEVGDREEGKREKKKKQQTGYFRWGKNFDGFDTI